MTTAFDQTLNWKLRKGSHEFPGKHGGTCINEAAIVAAGFPYCTVHDAHDCPPCFSRLFAQFLIGLNDAMRANLRQHMLMPFVTKLVGTADTEEIELERATIMIDRSIMILRSWKVIPTMMSLAMVARARDRALVGERDEATGRLVSIAKALIEAFEYTAIDLKREKPIYMLACNVLREAMRIGNQGTEVPRVLLEARMGEECAKAEQREAGLLEI